MTKGRTESGLFNESQSDQRAATARDFGAVADFIASGRRRWPRAQGSAICGSALAAMADFIQRGCFFMPGSFRRFVLCCDHYRCALRQGFG
jgi:hypothetical protein